MKKQKEALANRLPTLQSSGHLARQAMALNVQNGRSSLRGTLTTPDDPIIVALCLIHSAAKNCFPFDAHRPHKAVGYFKCGQCD